MGIDTANGEDMMVRRKTEEVGANPTREKFCDVLRGIQEHMFVTDDTAVYREEMRGWVNKVRDKSGVENVVFFPTGSVAVGMVSIEANSDIDGVVAYSCSEDKVSRVNDAIHEEGLPEEFNPFLVSSRVEDRIGEFFGRADMLSEDSRSYLTDSVALLFAPSLSELQNDDEHALVEGWRQQVVTELGKLSDGKGEVVWNLMRDWLEGQYVHYENSDGGDAEKRQRRVDMVIDKKVGERFAGFGEPEKRVKRAKSFIESMRANFHYPSFQEMQVVYSD